MNRCFDMGVPNLTSSERTKAIRNREIFQTFTDQVEDSISLANEKNRDIKVSKSNQIIFKDQETQLRYTKGLYEDALCGDDSDCIFIDKEGDGFGRENRILDLYQGEYTVQDTSGVEIDVSGELTFKLQYLEPLGSYYDLGCDRIQNYLEYTTISGEKPDRDNFNFKYPLSLYIDNE